LSKLVEIAAGKFTSVPKKPQTTQHRVISTSNSQAKLPLINKSEVQLPRIRSITTTN